MLGVSLVLSSAGKTFFQEFRKITLSGISDRENFNHLKMQLVEQSLE